MVGGHILHVERVCLADSQDKVGILAVWQVRACERETEVSAQAAKPDSQTQYRVGAERRLGRRQRQGEGEWRPCRG